MRYIFLCLMFFLAGCSTSHRVTLGDFSMSLDFKINKGAYEEDVNCNHDRYESYHGY